MNRRTTFCLGLGGVDSCCLFTGFSSEFFDYEDYAREYYCKCADYYDEGYYLVIHFNRICAFGSFRNGLTGFWLFDTLWLWLRYGGPAWVTGVRVLYVDRQVPVMSLVCMLCVLLGKFSVLRNQRHPIPFKTPHAMNFNFNLQICNQYLFNSVLM